MNATILLSSSGAVGLNHAAGYVTGAVIALLIFGYLLYSLINPEKF